MSKITIQASGCSSSFRQYECKECGSTMVIASDSNSPFCACCRAPLKEGEPVSRSEITASAGDSTGYVKCASCDAVYAVRSDESSEEFALSKYCVQCSCDSLLACSKDGETLTASEYMDDGMNDEQDNLMASPPYGGDDNSDIKEGLETGILNTDDSDYSELDASSFEDLQWSAVDTSEGEQTAMIASSNKTGNPIAIFRKKNAPTSMQPLFAQSLFVSAFNEVASTEGTANAIKAFGGSYFSEKALTAEDIEKAALSKLESSAIPRLIDCCQIAVEGGVKGIYTDVYASLQKSIVNELVASGVDAERANHAVASTFAIHGSELFGSIMAKAMDLFVKPETVRAEAKALIMQASTIVPPNPKQAEIRASMEKPVIDFGILQMNASASGGKNTDALRRELF